MTLALGHARDGARDDLADAVAVMAQLAHAALPALWAPEHFLSHTGQAVALPRRVLSLFATMVATVSQIGIAYFQAAYGENGGQVLYLVDATIAPLMPSTLLGVHRRMNELWNATPTPLPMNGGVRLFAQRVISDEIDRVVGRSMGAEPIDYLLSTGDLELAAAVIIAANKVRVAHSVLDKYGLGFLDGKAAGGDDVLRSAVLCGAIAAFQNDRLTPSRHIRGSNANLPNHL